MCQNKYIDEEQVVFDTGMVYIGINGNFKWLKGFMSTINKDCVTNLFALFFSV
jgi:hypothetical protein